MNFNEIKYSIKALAKSTSASVRLYQRENQVYYYSVYPINPDPFLLYEKDMLQSEQTAGIITTDLFQYYGYVTLDCEYRIVIGPSTILMKDKNKLDNLLFLLHVKENYQEEYVGKLECAPSISAERLAWFLSFIATTINKNPLFIEDVFVETNTDNYKHDIMNKSTQNKLLASYDKEVGTLVADSYQNEKMLIFYIKNGQSDTLRELLSALPKLKAGTMANDTLRQLKNMGICCATVASRTSIQGGLNVQTAFYLSDLYIQKIEMLCDSISINQLINQMIIDFAERTKQAKYNCNSSSKLFLRCANYVSRNLFTNIKVEDMATEFGMSRSHLCNQFHKQTDITLTQYILHEKIIESQRLLLFTNKSISEIALHLAFSSQSHFQTVFKKYTGITPNRFRDTKSDL